MIFSGIITLISFKYIPFISNHIKTTNDKEIHPNRKKISKPSTKKLDN